MMPESVPAGDRLHEKEWAAELTRQTLARLLARETAGFAEAEEEAAQADADLSVAHIRSEDFASVAAGTESALLSRPDALALSPAWMARFDRNACELRTRLFAAGYIPLKARLLHDGLSSLVYVRSDRLREPRAAGVTGPRKVSMTSLGNHGRFANQLWQYLFLHLYGLRNGIAIQLPEWIGNELFCFCDERLGPERFPLLEFSPYQLDDLKLWKRIDPPGGVDFKGFFQNIPEEWKPHRRYVRRLFAPKPAWNAALAEVVQRIERGRRTLVSIHVRRGDYVAMDPAIRPQFRCAPTEWYRNKLAGLWPALRHPVLHVATDDPERVLPDFSDFERLDHSILSPMASLPDYLRDFYLLRESTVMLACNSSFSVMAALQAFPGQRCHLPDFATGEFSPFDPWQETTFWNRFDPLPERKAWLLGRLIPKRFRSFGNWKKQLGFPG